MVETVDPGRLQHFCGKVLEAYGVPEVDAELLSRSLVQADLWGHQSHGVNHPPFIEHGRIEKFPQIQSKFHDRF
jgi:LDH2 family malate/lactate/ureidoglycolate dehydrogenase